MSSIGQNPASAHLDDAQFSLVTSDGESDIVALFRLGSKRLVCLIENKIDAPLQHRQAERYLERAADLVNAGATDEAVTVILAPEKYLGKETETKGFNKRVCYEQLADWFLQEAPASARSRYKAALLQSAIRKARRMPDPDPRITAFWHEYWHFAEREARELQMQEPGPRRGGFIYFHPQPLPNSVYLVHKLRFGHADLQFYGLSEHASALHGILKTKLPSDSSLLRAARSAVVRITVPPIRAKDTFTKQIPEAQKALVALIKLYRWYCFELPDDMRKSITDLVRATEKQEVTPAASCD